MKTRTLYLIIFVLAVIIIVTLIYTKSKISELNPPILEVTQVEVKQPEAITQSAGPVFFYKEAIRIVKPGQGRPRALPELNKTEEIIKDQKDLGLSPQSSSLTGGGGSDSQSTEEAAGITRLGKYPTPEETKEMNSKGIVMY